MIGHDWGSAVAWTFAGFYPERTLQLVGISVGHPSGYLKGDHRGEQKQKSWYVFRIGVRCCPPGHKVAAWPLPMLASCAEATGPI